MTKKTGLSARGAAVVALGVVFAAVGGYLAFGAVFGRGVERDLTSGDAERVVSALSRIDSDTLSEGASARLRDEALSALKSAPLEDVFNRLRSSDLSEEERARLEDNLRELMMAEMNKRIDEYEQAPDDQKDAILDRHLDEMVKFREEMEAYREKYKDDPDYQAYRAKQRERQASPSKEERKKRMEGMNPDRMAQMMRYWPKMMARAKERGVDFGPRARD